MNDTNLYNYFASPFLNQNKEFCKLNVIEEVFARVSAKDIFAIPYILTPDFIQIKDYVFVADLFNRYGEKTTTIAKHIKKVEALEKQFDGDTVKIEQMINSWSLIDFFCTQHSMNPLSEEEIETFGDILVYFWSKRLKELFPDKDIIVETGNEIMGELGLAITVYQRR